MSTTKSQKICGSVPDLRVNICELRNVYLNPPLHYIMLRHTLPPFSALCNMCMAPSCIKA